MYSWPVLTSLKGLADESHRELGDSVTDLGAQKTSAVLPSSDDGEKRWQEPVGCD